MSDLSEVLAQLLPSALGIAVSPLPIIASVLMLLSNRARQTAPAFAIGWLIGLTAVSVIVIAAAGAIGPSTSDPNSTVSYWLNLVLGVALAALAVSSWRKRPREGQEPEPPKWMGGLDAMKPLVALGLGAALSGLNPKNLALNIAASLAIAGGELSSGATVGCVILLVVIASLLVVGPVLAYFVAQQAMVAPLNGLKTFMQLHNAAIMATLLAVLALHSIGKGLGGLLS